ncbi:DsbA family protein [Heyndrickxia acidicola]|uniref:Thioredoxin domain-containing protein n=1 Tax=Heyndrickxia acidicola TaxID=209389 RepID=A0ABU6MCJ9_9BACI|nr:thioredoxin domain-containing protein [Heyndrickxia acidicola]MED1202381.1 thioredoxin domain-containing protein [Heyndrickxia acidicola]
MANKTKNKNQSSRAFFYWMVGLVVVCIGTIILLAKVNSASHQDATFNYNNEPYLGNKNAPVNIVEFGDYKCPVCKNFNATVFPDIIKDLVQTGKAKYYFMNDPFIYRDSTRAAQFAETVYIELGNTAFWKFHDHLYEKQPDGSKYESTDVYSLNFLQDTLKDVAGDKDTQKVVTAFKQQKYKAALKKDINYVNKLKIDGTPTIFVDGKLFKGQSYSDLINLVNKKAKEKGM